MRKLMYFTLGFGLACGICAYLLPGEYRKAAAVTAGCLCIAALLLSRSSKTILRAAIGLLGCSAGFFWFVQYNAHYLAPAAPLDGQNRTVTIRAADYSYDTAYGAAFDGTIVLKDKTYQVKTYLKEGVSLEPGQTIRGEFLFRVTAPDAMEESLYHQGKGIFLLAYQRSDVTVGRSEPNWLDGVASLRVKIRAILRTSFPEDTFPFAQALLLGDSSELDYQTDTDFKLSGIRHVIAVSGLHVSILFALISTVTFRKRFLTALLGFPTLLLFAALAGFSPSVVRACVMSGLMLLALLAGKTYDGPTALSFAVLVMLLANPMGITNVGFQLSVGSVAGIYLFDAPVRKWLLSLFGEEKRKNIIIRWICTSVSITISAMTITTPLCAIYFGTISLVSVVTNLLTVWVISFIFYGIIAVCLAALLSAPAAGFLASVISLPIRYVLVTAGILADFPLAAVYTCSPYITAWLVFVYLLLGAFLVMKKKRPQILICSAVLGLCMALLASWAEPMLTDMRFTVLDVGQGQCLLMQYRGSTVMVDCGGDSDTKTADLAAQTLLSQGITRLDCLILTHLDRDHAGAAANLLSRVDTDLLILPEEATDLPQRTGGEVICATEDLRITCGGLEVEIFTPDFPGNSNEMSLCILFEAENCDILITGDRSGFGEQSLLRHHAIADVDILVAGHHGSKHSTCEELLAAVRPEIVCISVGEDNSYGHPAPELLQRLETYGCTVYRTDLHETILIRR